MTLGYVLANNPIAAIFSHIAMHIAGVLHGPATVMHLPPTVKHALLCELGLSCPWTKEKVCSHYD
jgi:hypothetical protein